MTMTDRSSEVRTACRDNGLTFRRHPTKARLYQVVDRGDKSVVIDNVPLNTLHRACWAGFFDCYDPVSKTFDHEQMKNYDLFEVEK